MLEGRPRSTWFSGGSVISFEQRCWCICKANVHLATLVGTAVVGKVVDWVVVLPRRCKLFLRYFATLVLGGVNGKITTPPRENSPKF